MAKPGKKLAKAEEPKPVAGAVDLALLREKITNLVATNAVTMVDTTIEQVKAGHYQALKYLFEMIGLFPAVTESESEEDSLAKTLLKHLGLLEEADSNLDLTKDRTLVPGIPERSTVK